jgi:hypothetical protein
VLGDLVGLSMLYLQYADLAGLLPLAVWEKIVGMVWLFIFVRFLAQASHSFTTVSVLSIKTWSLVRGMHRVDAIELSRTR